MSSPTQDPHSSDYEEAEEQTLNDEKIKPHDICYKDPQLSENIIAKIEEDFKNLKFEEESEAKTKYSQFKKMKNMNFALLNTFKLFQEQFSDSEDTDTEDKDKDDLPSYTVTTAKTDEITNSQLLSQTFEKTNETIEEVKPEVGYTEKKHSNASMKDKMNDKKSFFSSFDRKNFKAKLKKKNEGIKSSRYFNKSFYKNNPSYVVCFFIYVALSIFFVLLQTLVLHPNIPWYVVFARSAAILIYFNTDLILLTVLRRNVTWFRNTTIGKKLTFIDEFIEFHKFMGIWNFILSWIHSIGQCINLYYLSDSYSGNFVTVFDPTTNKTIIVNKSKGNYGQTLFWIQSGVGWVGAGAAPTGWILLVVLCIMVFFAMPFIRRNGYFQAFYFTHKLYYVYFVVFFFHAAHFWKWFLPVLILWMIEISINLYRKNNSKFGDTYIKDVNLLSSKVTHLVITRPKGFKFQSGDYVFIKIPDIAKHEWHPFTISSATELKDEIWVHVRSLGTWTNRLNQHFTELANEQKDQIQKGYEKVMLKQHNELETKDTVIRTRKQLSQLQKTVSNMVIVTDFNNNIDNSQLTKQVNIVSDKLHSVFVPIQLDGPYGTASGRIFDSEHAVLIAGGIGVTPFASILQSLWFQHIQSLKSCVKCDYQWYDKYERKSLKKVDFIWVNRDFEAFEWFVELLAELELQQSQLEIVDRFLTIHLYMTTAKVEQQIKCNIDPNNIHGMKKKRFLNEMLKESNKNFSLKLIPGRPRFIDIFRNIQYENKGKVDVYFCGAPQMGQEILKNCKHFDFNFSQENF